MLVFDITAKSRGEGLPSLTKWLNPQYDGRGDLELAKMVTDLQYNDPKNWQNDFPDYNYNWDRFQKLKHDLNVEKSKLDKYHANVYKAKKYETVSNLTQRLTNLRGPAGKISMEYGAEVVSNAWLKMYELCIFCNELFGKVSRSRDKILNTVHFAEAPGNFILSINHYLRNHYPVAWQWKANSYRDLYSDATSIYLSDHHKIISTFPENWFYGVDGDGDITSPNNIRSFSEEVSSTENEAPSTNGKKAKKIHLATSDVKYAPKEMNYSEEERINIPVHMGQILSVLNTLSKNGMMIIKELTFYEPMTICLIYLLSNCFEQLLVVKPETSRPFNSEVYLVGVGYKANVNAEMMDRLLSIMNYIREMNTGAPVPALFQQNDVPITFLDRLYDIAETLMQSQSDALNQNIQTYKKYELMDFNDIEAHNADQAQIEAETWCKCTNIQPLGYSDRLIH